MTVTATGRSTGSVPEVVDHLGSLSTLIDVVSGLCGGPVVLYDADWQLVAYSGGGEADPVRIEALLARRLPPHQLDRLREAGVVDRVLRGEVVHVQPGELPGLGHRYGAAVLVGGQVLGTMWVAPDGELDDAATRRAMQGGVALAASALVRQPMFGSSSQAHSPGLGALLDGGQTERLVAEHLQVPTDGGFALAGLRAVGGDATERAVSARRLAGLARDCCEAYRTDALATAVGDTAYVLFPSATTEHRQQALRVLTLLQERLQHRVQNRAILSSGFGDLNQAAVARRSVDQLLGLAERQHWTGVTDAESVNAALRLAQFRELALAHPSLLDGPARRLLDHDSCHAGRLVETLRAYFEAVGDTNEAGRILGLHPNTVRYRMRKIEDVTGLRLGDPDERLLAELQVRLLIP